MFLNHDVDHSWRARRCIGSFHLRRTKGVETMNLQELERLLREAQSHVNMGRPNAASKCLLAAQSIVLTEMGKMNLQPQDVLVAAERGTGRTSRQILDAPDSAYFIVPGVVDYYRSLAQHLGRSDIRFVIACHVEYYRFELGAYIVVDHAVALTERQTDTLRGWGW
jgi:hypothetical protein